MCINSCDIATKKSINITEILIRWHTPKHNQHYFISKSTEYKDLRKSGHLFLSFSVDKIVSQIDC